jgi:hypothetical protein
LPLPGQFVTHASNLWGYLDVDAACTNKNHQLKGWQFSYDHRILYGAEQGLRGFARTLGVFEQSQSGNIGLAEQRNTMVSTIALAAFALSCEAYCGNWLLPGFYAEAKDLHFVW